MCVNELCENSQPACWYACLCVCVCEEVEGLLGVRHGMAVQTVHKSRKKRKGGEKKRRRLFTCVSCTEGYML